MTEERTALLHAKGLSSLRTIHRMTAGFNAAPSPGLALRTILSSSDLLRAKACAVVSPATTSTSPDWIANLLRPAYRDSYDFVAPLYQPPQIPRIAGAQSSLPDDPRNFRAQDSRAVFG